MIIGSKIRLSVPRTVNDLPLHHPHVRHFQRLFSSNRARVSGRYIMQQRCALQGNQPSMTHMTLADGQDSIRRLLDLTYRRQVEAFQALMTDDAWEKLSAELLPSERQQLETIVLDMQFLRYLPTGTSSGKAADLAWSEYNNAEAFGSMQSRPPSISELREMQDTQLAVRQMPSDLKR